MVTTPGEQLCFGGGTCALRVLSLVYCCVKHLGYSPVHCPSQSNHVWLWVYSSLFLSVCQSLWSLLLGWSDLNAIFLFTRMVYNSLSAVPPSACPWLSLPRTSSTQSAKKGMNSHATQMSMPKLLLFRFRVGEFISIWTFWPPNIR